jgi:ketosteroid isomerase-like protein
MVDEAGSGISERLQRVEDELDILRLVSSYGPAVDAGDGEAAANIWTEDGIYDTESAVWRGRAEIAGMIIDTHEMVNRDDVAHVLGVPHILLDGDRAVATCYSRTFRRRDDGFEVWRLAANRWEMVRTTEGWRAAYRTTRLIDASGAARSLLQRAPDIDGS